MRIILWSIFFTLLTVVKAQHNYLEALHLSTRFLGAQRSGATQSWALPIGNATFANDGSAVGKDLSGGWNDCGDYIKFHLTGPYTALINLYGYYCFPEAYPDFYNTAYSQAPGNGIPDVLDEVKIQTDYLLKCIYGDTVYWQIGDGRDHDYFQEPMSQQKLKIYNGTADRAVYWTTEGKSNALGAAAAALGLMAKVYHPFDSSYAQQCILAAQQYYTIGAKNPGITADARKEDGFYEWLGGEWSGYHDEMGMGALMIFLNTQDSTYLKRAEAHASNANEWGDFSYGGIDHLLYYELYKTTNKYSYLSPVTWRARNYKPAQCGYVHISQWGSLRDAANAALIAFLYYEESGNKWSYQWAKQTIDFILGSHDGILPDAPKNSSFLIGYNQLKGGYPKYPHHAGAFGKGDDAWEWYTKESEQKGSVPYAYELTGGLAGGPQESCGKFIDNINDYVSSEYCSYYNAALNTALAYLVVKEKQIEQHAQFNNIHQLRHTISNTELGIQLSGTSKLSLINISSEELVWESEVFMHIKLIRSDFEQGEYWLKDELSGYAIKVTL